MSINRTYGDNGELLRYEVEKEMVARKTRYTKDTLSNAVVPYVVIALGVGFLTVWYLINN